MYKACTLNDYERVKEEMRSKAHGKTLYVVWTAGPKDGAGPAVSWCGDCNRAVPAVREAAEAKGACLLEVSVGSREEYQSPGHYLRVHPDYQPFNGIPMLTAFVDGELVGQNSKELEAAKSHEKALEIAETFINEHWIKIPSPLKCPWVRYGLVGAAVLGVVVFVAVAYNSESSSSKDGATQRTPPPPPPGPAAPRK